MNEFLILAADLRNAGRTEAADAAEKISAPRETMRVTHQAQAAYGGQAWNGWQFMRVRNELRMQKVAPAIGLEIVNALRELEEDDRLGEM